MRIGSDINAYQLEVVAFGNEVHVMGNLGNSTGYVHYQLTGGSWRQLDDVAPVQAGASLSLVDPDTGQLGLAWVENGRLMYLMGQRNGDGTYTWDSSATVCYDGSAVGVSDIISTYMQGVGQKLWVLFNTGVVAPYDLRVTSCGP